jgi:hypothetical protein
MKFVILLVAISIGGVVFGQDTAQNKKESMFVIPSEIVLPVVAYQPDCPLKFENLKLLQNAEKGTPSADHFELRNISNKAIRDFTVASYSSYGGMWSRSRPANQLKNLVLPGALAPPLSEGDQAEIVELTEAMRDRLKLGDQPMGGVAVFMVVRVEFADGTVFTDEKASRALGVYFQKLGEYQ